MRFQENCDFMLVKITISRVGSYYQQLIQGDCIKPNHLIEKKEEFSKNSPKREKLSRRVIAFALVPWHSTTELVKKLFVTSLLTQYS